MGNIVNVLGLLVNVDKGYILLAVLFMAASN